MTDEAALTRTLLWLTEQHVLPYFDEAKRCERCGHDQDDHRLDSDTNISPTDPAAQFPCTYPAARTNAPAQELCECPQYVAPLCIEGWGPGCVSYTGGHSCKNRADHIGPHECFDCGDTQEAA